MKQEKKLKTFSFNNPIQNTHVQKLDGKVPWGLYSFTNHDFKESIQYQTNRYRYLWEKTSYNHLSYSLYQSVVWKVSNCYFAKLALTLQIHFLTS